MCENGVLNIGKVGDFQCELVLDNTFQVPATSRNDRLHVTHILGRIATRPDDGLLRIGQMQQVERMRFVVDRNGDKTAPNLSQPHKVVDLRLRAPCRNAPTASHRKRLD